MGTILCNQPHLQVIAAICVHCFYCGSSRRYWQMHAVQHPLLHTFCTRELKRWMISVLLTNWERGSDTYCHARFIPPFPIEEPTGFSDMWCPISFWRMPCSHSSPRGLQYERRQLSKTKRDRAALNPADNSEMWTSEDSASCRHHHLSNGTTRRVSETFQLVTALRGMEFNWSRRLGRATSSGFNNFRNQAAAISWCTPTQISSGTNMISISPEECSGMRSHFDYLQFQVSICIDGG